MLHLLDFAVRRCLRDTVPIGEREADAIVARLRERYPAERP